VTHSAESSFPHPPSLAAGIVVVVRAEVAARVTTTDREPWCSRAAHYWSPLCPWQFARRLWEVWEWWHDWWRFCEFLRDMPSLNQI